MAYTKAHDPWVDGVDGGTRIDAADLNNMEQGIADAHAALTAQSIHEHWGPGRPDVAGTLDAAGTAWVTAATQGAVFHSITGDQGAQVWTKTAAGWVVTLGDTEWRVSTDPQAEFGADPCVQSFAIRRLATVAQWWMHLTRQGETWPYSQTIITLPAALSAPTIFNVGGQNKGPVPPLSQSLYDLQSDHPALNGNTIKFGSLAINSTNFSAYGSYFPAAAWPTTLTGSPIL